MLCGQYAQSSGHAPVLIDSNVETCTAFGSKFSRCTHCASYSKSLSGSANSASTCATRPFAPRLRRRPALPPAISFSQFRHFAARSIRARMTQFEYSGADSIGLSTCDGGRGLRAAAAAVSEGCPGCAGIVGRGILRRLRRATSRACRTRAPLRPPAARSRSARGARAPGT